MRLLAATFLLVLTTGSQLLPAQRTPGMLISTPPPRVRPMPQHFFQSPIFWGAPWFADYYNPGQQPAPQVVVVQPQPAAPEAKKEEAKPITPLMIELQDGHYVRSDAKATTDSQVELAPSRAARNEETVSSIQSKQSQPAVLVFRDGHREKVREYTLADGALYVHGDYWTDGYWNKKILLSALDLPKTVAVNRESGVAFVLPSGPNVVVVGP